MVTHYGLIEFVFAEDAVEGSDTAHLLDVFDAFSFSALGLELVFDHHAVDGVQLV